MAECRENSVIKSFIMSMAIAEIASEVSELFHESIADLMDEEDSEELDDAMEITNVIKECERVVEGGNNTTQDHLDALILMITDLPDRIMRPYSQMFRLTDGNRMDNSNWEEKFPSQSYWELFRFRKSDMELIATALEVPDTFIAGNGYKSCKMEGLHLMLRRLASPCRWVDLSKEFCLTPQSMSVIFNHLLTLMFRKWGDFIRALDHDWMNAEHMQEYAAAYERMGCPLRNTVLSIDGTKHCFSRPGHGLQEACYCGHWHEHCLGYQFLQLPNGHNLCFGPFNGFEHDSTSIKMIQLEDELCEKLRGDGTEYVGFADSGYALGNFIITPFSRRRNLTAEEREFNRTMSSLRQSSEWGIGRVKSLWSYLEYKKNLRVLSMPLSMMFLLAVHLGNLHSCLYGNQTAQYFDCKELSLAEYLGLPE